MTESDRNKLIESIATLMELSKKYSTPIDLNIGFRAVDTGDVDMKIMGEKGHVIWYTEFDRLSFILRAGKLVGNILK